MKTIWIIAASAHDASQYASRHNITDRALGGNVVGVYRPENMQLETYLPDEIHLVNGWVQSNWRAHMFQHALYEVAARHDGDPIGVDIIGSEWVQHVIDALDGKANPDVVASPDDTDETTRDPNQATYAALGATTEALKSDLTAHANGIAAALGALTAEELSRLFEPITPPRFEPPAPELTAEERAHVDAIGIHDQEHPERSAK